MTIISCVGTFSRLTPPIPPQPGIFDIDGTFYENNLTLFSDAAYPNNITPEGVSSSPDGLRMYAITSSGIIYQYDLTTAFDFSTAVYNDDNISVSSYTGTTGNNRDLFFDDSGTRVFVISDATERVTQFTLTTPWDIMSLTYNGLQFNLTSPSESTHKAIVISSDGTKYFVLGNSTDSVFQYEMTTAWDITQSVYSNKSFYVGGSETTPEAIAITSDGRTLLVGGTTSDSIYEFLLDTPWDLTGVTLIGEQHVSSRLSVLRGLCYHPDYLIATSQTSNNVITFKLKTTVESSSYPIEYLVVAGGGGGGGGGRNSAISGGGGGAGGYRTSFSTNTVSGRNSNVESPISITPDTSYTVTVGAGGSGGVRINGSNAGKGGNSIFASIISTGGGGALSSTTVTTNRDGGSGAGGIGYLVGTSPGGTGTANQGFNGGSAQFHGGGGGGAASVGTNAEYGGSGTYVRGGNGGNGIYTPLTNTTYAGGGGAGGVYPNTTQFPSSTRGTGGTGGGGAGGKYNLASPSPGTANRGGGGGGGGGSTQVGGDAYAQNGAAGGSGIVILKYPKNLTLLNSDGGLTFSTELIGDYNVTTFTQGTGSIQFSVNPPKVLNIIQEFAEGASERMGSLRFNNTGSMMYTLRGATIYEYSLSTPYDISTSTYTGNSYPGELQDYTLDQNIFFDPTGTRYYIIGYNNSGISQYSMTSPYDLNSRSFVASKNFFSGTGNLNIGSGGGQMGVHITPDGTKLFVALSNSSLGSHGIFRADFGTPWDVSTLTTDISKTNYKFLHTTHGLSANIIPEFSFSPDARKLYLYDKGTKLIMQFGLSSPYSIGSCVLEKTYDVNYLDNSTFSYVSFTIDKGVLIFHGNSRRFTTQFNV